MMYDRFNQGGGTDAWGLMFMTFMMALIFLGAILAARYLLISARGNSNKEDSSGEILKNRYAKGEIDKKEFEEKNKDLKD
jgi:putative membrane protein